MLRLRHHRIQRWLGAGVRVWPDPVTPVNVFDRTSDTRRDRRSSSSALVCIRAEGGVILRSESLGRLLRQIDRRAEGDNHARKEQRGRAAAKNVSANFAFRFHSYISVLRREPCVAIDPAGRGSGGALGRRLTNLTRARSCRVSPANGKTNVTWLPPPGGVRWL